MDYYHISLRKAPIIIFAHEYKTEKYRWNALKRDGITEITYIDQGDATKIYPNGVSKYFKAPCFMINLYNGDVKLRSDVFHRHYTTGFFLDYNLISITKKPPQLQNYEPHMFPNGEIPVVLPEYVAVKKDNEQLKAMMFRLINIHEMPTVWSIAECSALILSLISELSANCIKDSLNNKTERFRPSMLRYFNIATNYIMENIEDKLSIEEIAAHTGISSGYLSRMFKEISGRSIVEYINYTKIEKVKELIATKNKSLREAGEDVGINDQNYLSRMFKKYTKLTVREFKTMKHF